MLNKTLLFVFTQRNISENKVYSHSILVYSFNSKPNLLLNKKQDQLNSLLYGAVCI